MARKTQEQVNNECIPLDTEEWRDVADYEGIYQVSSLGRVKHLTTVFVELATNGRVVQTRNSREYILTQTTIKQGYLRVGLVRAGNINSIGVHRLVAQAFVPKLPDQVEVHHIDKNRSNNSPCNLQWVSSSEHDEYHRSKPRH